MMPASVFVYTTSRYRPLAQTIDGTRNRVGSDKGPTQNVRSRKTYTGQLLLSTKGGTG